MWNAACYNECAHVLNLTEKYEAIELDEMSVCTTHSTTMHFDNNIERNYLETGTLEKSIGVSQLLEAKIGNFCIH